MTRLLLALLTVTCFADTEPSYKEYQVKAAFLYNLTKYVEWPADTFKGDRAPIVIGVLKRNPFGDQLEQAVAGRRVNGRTVQVKLVSTAAEIRGVHLLFVPEAEAKRFEELSPELAAMPLLTVGEADRFTAGGGVIQLIRAADKIRFAVDLEAGEARRLKISAQLLKLAVTVHRKS